MPLTSLASAQRRKLGSTNWLELWCIMGTRSSSRNSVRIRQSRTALRVMHPGRAWDFTLHLCWYVDWATGDKLLCSSQEMLFENCTHWIWAIRSSLYMSWGSPFARSRTPIVANPWKTKRIVFINVSNHSPLVNLSPSQLTCYFKVDIYEKIHLRERHFPLCISLLISRTSSLLWPNTRSLVRWQPGFFLLCCLFHSDTCWTWPDQALVYTSSYHDSHLDNLTLKGREMEQQEGLTAAGPTHHMPTSGLISLTLHSTSSIVKGWFIPNNSTFCITVWTSVSWIPDDRRNQ